MAMLLKRVALVSVSALVLALIGWCGISEYTIRTMSAPIVLRRLAGVTDVSANDATLRQALIERIPIGTRDIDILAFLETQGVTRDRFRGGQFFRYQMQDHPPTILALLTSPPWIIQIFCGQPDYGVRFVLDRERKLEDVLIEDYTRCL